MARGASETASPQPAPRIPGEAGVWIVVLGDLLVFALFFATVAFYRLSDPALFRTAQATLDQRSGLINTLLLLTSSWCVVRAVEAARAGATRTAPRWTGAALAMGAGFIVIKVLEYDNKVAVGLLPTSNDFYMLYFIFTGIHLIHVAIGVLALAFVRAAVAKPLSGGHLGLVESCAIFWHMVDVLWVMLFAIFYLHR